MNNLARFLSLADPTETGYIVYADSMAMWRYRSNAPIANWVAAYPTYHDGIVQHGSEYPVQRERMGDFLASLAEHLTKTPEDVELVAKHWPNYLPHWKDVVFLAELKHRDDKRVYYCRGERKVSTAESKRHDKRWQEVPRETGTVQSVCSMLDLSHEGFLKSYAIWQHVYQVMSDRDLTGHVDIPKELGLTEKHVAQAFSAVNCLVAAWRKQEDAARYLESYKDNVAYDLKAAESRAAAARAARDQAAAEAAKESAAG